MSDYISSTPLIISSDVNLFVWDFSDFRPFETREIVVRLYINSPTDKPLLYDSDILDFIVSVIPSEVDETPSNNTFNTSKMVSTVILNTAKYTFSD